VNATELDRLAAGLASRPVMVGPDDGTRSHRFGCRVCFAADGWAAFEESRFTTEAALAAHLLAAHGVA
jgi:hypothetical protein